MSGSVDYQVSDGVATVTLNRPEAMNALTVDMKLALLDSLHRAAADESARAVLLTGAGRAFCVGQDLREHEQTLREGAGPTMSTVRDHYNPIARAVTGLPKPVVAAVAGSAAGAGASLAFACDLRVAADDAVFLMAFSRVGLGADTGGSWTLPRLVGYGPAVQMLMLGEPVTADRALAMGLVHRVVPGDQLAAAAGELAARLAAGPTLAYAAIKEAVAFAATHSLEESLELEADLQSRCGGTEDHRAATAAFLAKERPVFRGR